MKLFLPVLLLLIASCATTPTTASLNQQIYAADQGVTAVVSSTDAALNAKLITKAQAQSVSTIAHQVNPLLDSARAAIAASDTAGATKTMNLVNALLAGLMSYVPPPVAGAKP